MQYCTSCQKAIATVHILDLREGSIVNQQHLCPNCAEQQGVVQQKTSALKLPPEALEELFGAGAKVTGEGRKKAPKDGPVCEGCRLSAADFKVRGRLGCPRCYEVFRASLLPLLERVHDATSHRGRFPGRRASAAAATAPDILADLRTKLAAAVRSEKYEEAARLRDQLRIAELEGGGRSAEGSGHGQPES